MTLNRLKNTLIKNQNIILLNNKYNKRFLQENSNSLQIKHNILNLRRLPSSGVAAVGQIFISSLLSLDLLFSLNLLRHSAVFKMVFVCDLCRNVFKKDGKWLKKHLAKNL